MSDEDDDNKTGINRGKLTGKARVPVLSCERIWED